MFVEYDFTIFIEPCIVNTYIATLEVADISYNIGAPELANVSPYVFDEDPVCNYPETVTLTNLPVFVTHNAPTSDDFTVPYSDDLGLIGSYVVIIRSEIQIPDDYTKTTFSTMSAQHEFTVFVEPCLVSTYLATKQISAIVYNVNQETLTDGHYIFDEDPVCNYPETVTVTNLPIWATHNEPSSDFTIPQNNDLDLIGEYTVTIKSEIQVPDDHTKMTFTAMFVEYDFVIQVEECLVDTYTADKIIESISYNIGAPDLTSTKYSFVEDPVCNYPETVTLFNLPDFVIHNEDTSDFLIPQNRDLSLIGKYTVTIRSEISIPDDYTKTTYTTMFVEYDFDILIEPCLVNSYTDTTTISVISYNVGEPELTGGDYKFDEDPTCNYPETVTISNLPDFVIHSEENSNFVIPKNHDLDIIGGYTVTIRSEIQVPTDYSKTDFITMYIEYEFEIKIEECIINAYDATEIITDITYIIGDPEFLSSKYLFDETPVCNYPETVTVTNLPSFASHNELAKDFNIPMTEQHDLDGIYTVTLKSEIQVPDDYTKTTFTTWF